METLAGYLFFVTLIIVNTSLHVFIWKSLDGELPE